MGSSKYQSCRCTRLCRTHYTSYPGNVCWGMQSMRVPPGNIMYIILYIKYREYSWLERSRSSGENRWFFPATWTRPYKVGNISALYVLDHSSELWYICYVLCSRPDNAQHDLVRRYFMDIPEIKNELKENRTGKSIHLLCNGLHTVRHRCVGAGLGVVSTWS